MNKEKLSKILAEFCRILIGVTFIFSGAVKAIDPVGGAIKIGDYLTAFGLNHFSWMENILSFNLASIEFTLGICLLLAVYRRLTTFCVLLFMCFMTPLTLYLALFDPVSDCGCFGDAIIISNWATFFKNVPLLMAAIITFIFHKRLTACYTYKVYWSVVLFAYFFCMAFCYHNYTHLPIKDFRPYKVGLNILKLMEIPEDAPQDEFLLIYEKEGVRQEFKLEEAPFDDESWSYVEKKFIREGFIPVVSSFELYNKNEDNISDAILTHPQLTFLLIIPTIAEASDIHIDDINNVYDHAVETKLPFYGVTTSNEEAIEEWRNNTGADYPFLTADDVLLKTMIRSNPGLIVLKNGTILAKWHHNDIPGEEKLAEVITALDETPIDEEDLTAPAIMAEKSLKERVSWLRIITGFTLPLSLIWLLDFFMNRQIRKKRKIIN
jgi:uncharacterized membrane protein YphA (DoxX/SURF4 family)